MSKQNLVLERNKYRPETVNDDRKTAARQSGGHLPDQIVLPTDHCYWFGCSRGRGEVGGGRGNSGPTPISLGDDGHAGRGTGRHRRPDAAGREHFGAPVVGAGADRPHLVAQLGRHHPQELVPLLRQRLRRLHRTLPAGPRLPLPAETATTTTATTTTAAAAAAAAAARSRKQSVVSVPVSSFSSLPWRRRAR